MAGRRGKLGKSRQRILVSRSGITMSNQRVQRIARQRCRPPQQSRDGRYYFSISTCMLTRSVVRTAENLQPQRVTAAGTPKNVLISLYNTCTRFCVGEGGHGHAGGAKETKSWPKRAERPAERAARSKRGCVRTGSGACF